MTKFWDIQETIAFFMQKKGNHILNAYKYMVSSFYFLVRIG